MKQILPVAKKWVPLSLRAEWGRVRRRWSDRQTPYSLATGRGKPHDFRYLMAKSSSPLERRPGATATHLQRAKERNLSIAAPLFDCLLIKPGELLSYHAIVGRPTRSRGFLPGLELHDGKMAKGVGGGCCQISNMLYWLAINAGLTIVERHRHQFDLFPDCERSVPFGCGATVFYNYRDLRFRNDLNAPVLVRLRIAAGYLTGQIYTAEDPQFRIQIIERDHRFFFEGQHHMRENKIFRAVTDREGNQKSIELLAHNRCRVLY